MEVIILHEPGKLDPAERIAATLRQLGYATWSSDDVEVGEQPAREISERFAAGGPIVICGTKSLAGSTWLVGLVAAVKESSRSGPERLFPVRVEVGAHLETHMRGAKIAECGTNFESGLKDLVRALCSRFPLHVSDTRRVIAEIEDESRTANFDGWLSSCEEFSKVQLQLYRERLRSESREILNDELDGITFLEHANLARNGRLFGAGVLLFAEHPEYFAPTAYVQCVRFRGRDRSSSQENKDLYGPVVIQIEGAMEFIISRIEKSEVLEPGEMASKTDYQFPMICFREVLANAICHRDYGDQKRHVYVRLYENRIEVANPGPWGAQPLKGGEEVLLQELRSEPASRNERLAAALRRIQFVETQGSGIANAISDCTEQGADSPKVKYETEMVVVTIFPRRDWNTLSIQRREHRKLVTLGTPEAPPPRNPELHSDEPQREALTPKPVKPVALPLPSLGPLFQGREEMITLLREKLTQTPAGRTTAITGKAIHGLGGVGKTRLAVEYAWRHAASYTALLFVDAGSFADLRRNLAALCERSVLDLPEQAAPEEEAREVAVLRWLGEQPGWLLILDNVDSEEAAAAVDVLVTRLHGGHVLLTGRLARWSAEVERFELNVLTEEAAAGFLLARTKARRRTTEKDADHAAVLACELGFLPLALEQAGAYIAERRLTLAAYLEEWKTQHDQILTRLDPRVSHYPASVAVTWQTSFERLSAPARQLLERLAWLGAEPIPETLLDVAVPESPEEPDRRDALVELTTYSLVTRDSETPTFTAHRLVQDVTRRSLRNGTDESLIEALIGALRWIDAAFVGDPSDVRTWPTLDPLAPHARAVTLYADAAGIAAPTARLMNDLAQLLAAKSLLGEAEPLMRRALAIDEKSFGPEHTKVAIGLNNLAALLQATNRLSESEPLMRRALAIDEKSFGPEHPEVAIDLNNLAQLLQDTNRLSESEPLMRRALSIDEKSFGTEHPNVARDLNNLAQLLQDTNRLSESEPLMRRALAIDEKSFGTEHPNVATDLNNLAQLLQATNRLSESEPLMRRALAIDEKSFGTEHPNVAIRLNNLAQLLQDTNRLSESEPLMRRVVTIFESSLGEDHPNVAAALTNLALLLQATNRLSESEPLMRRVLGILLDITRHTGREHPHLQTVFGNYRLLLQVMGMPDTEIEAALAGLAGSPE